MNTYYLGTIPVTDELYHHGILGQKWGVRRYQNKDGTLTEEGKKRYGSEKEKKKLAYMTIKGNVNLRKSPQVQHAAANLKSSVEAALQNSTKEYDEEVDKFFNNSSLYDEYAGKAADKFLKDYPMVAQEYRESRMVPQRFKDMSDRDLIKWMFKNDDWGQGDYDPLTVFEKSGDKRAKGLLDADKAYAQSQINLSKASRQYAKDFLGSYGDQEYRKAINGVPGGFKRKVEDTVNNVIYYSAIEKHTGKKFL